MQTNPGTREYDVLCEANHNTVTRLQPAERLADCRKKGHTSVYSDKVLNAAEAARRSGTAQVKMIDLSEE
jgi:hypothetical protein